MADCCDPIVPPSTCPKRCNPLIDADCVIDASGYACLDIEPESSQAEINAAIIAALCSLDPPSGTCPEFVDIDLEAGWSDFAGLSTAGVSDPIGCVCRMRGGIEQEFGDAEEACTVYQLTITNTVLPANQRPATNKRLSVNAVLVETLNPSENRSYFVPAFITILTTGDVAVAFYDNRTCLNPIYAPFKIILSLDGLTYETN